MSNPTSLDVTFKGLLVIWLQTTILAFSTTVPLLRWHEFQPKHVTHLSKKCTTLHISAISPHFCLDVSSTYNALPCNSVSHVVLESHPSFMAWTPTPTFCLMYSLIPTVEIQPWIVSFFIVENISALYPHSSSLYATFTNSTKCPVKNHCSQWQNWGFKCRSSGSKYPAHAPYHRWHLQKSLPPVFPAH